MYQANISILINKKVISNRKSTKKILEKKAEYAILNAKKAFKS